MQSKTIALIAGLILLTALGSLWFTMRPGRPPVDHALYTSLGQGLAQEAATAIHDRGQIVAVIADFHEKSGTVWHEQWQAFTGELKKHSSISLAKPENANLGHVPLADMVNRHAQASAIVFFMDPPDSVDLDAVANRQVLPQLVVVANAGLPAKSTYGKYLSSGILTALILQRPVTDPAPVAQPKTPREWFDKYYQIYTPQNFESLPD